MAKSSAIVPAPKGFLGLFSGGSKRTSAGSNSGDQQQYAGAIVPDVKTFGFSETILTKLRYYYSLDFSNIASWTNQDYARFHYVVEQFKFLRSIIPNLKSGWTEIVNGTKEWSAVVKEMEQEGLAGASEIDKNVVEMAIADAKHSEKFQQQQYRGQKKVEALKGETQNFKSLENDKTAFLMQAATDKIAKDLEEFKQNFAARSALSAEISEWKEGLPSEFEAAKLFLNEGLNAATHPKMGQFLPSEGSDWTQNVAVFQDWGQQQPATRSPALDSIDFHWSGNIASLVSRTAGAIGQTMGRGMRKMKDFFK